ncbi:hypothetical protein ACTXMZ_16575 [Brachybacterium alimentarium]|uniref:hypothetical protein n=1 Tax=Brachybacterium alimentarium TaxID=47845 RepID=UPI003FD1A3E3
MTTIDRDRLRRYLSHAAMLLPPDERVVTVEEGAALLDALEQAEARIKAVQELHAPFEWSFGYGPVRSCKACTDISEVVGNALWPCPTIRALDAP